MIEGSLQLGFAAETGDAHIVRCELFYRLANLAINTRNGMPQIQARKIDVTLVGCVRNR
jgi:hypothetical protein